MMAEDARTGARSKAPHATLRFSTSRFGARFLPPPALGLRRQAGKLPARRPDQRAETDALRRRSLLDEQLRRRTPQPGFVFEPLGQGRDRARKFINQRPIFSGGSLSKNIFERPRHEPQHYQPGTEWS